MCDVMCITNTQSVCKVPVELPTFLTEKADATMPYKHNGVTKLPKGNTSYTLFKNIELKNVRSEEMKKEREAFFEKMDRDRREKAEKESVAVVKIQAFVRGVLVRRPEDKRVSKKPPILRIGVVNCPAVRKIQDELCDYCHLLGLKPIAGLSLETRLKQNKRRRRIELAAAIRLQSYFRMVVCMIQTKSKLKIARECAVHHASLVITKFFKWVRRVAAQNKILNAHRTTSVIRIQTRFRMFRAYHRVKKLKAARTYHVRTHNAQIVIRRNLYDLKLRKAMKKINAKK